MRGAKHAGLAVAFLLLTASGSASQELAAPNLALPALTVPDLIAPDRVGPDLSAVRPKPPRKRQREAMQPCPSQGPGFVRLPGSATCVRVSGRAVGGVDIGAHGAAPVTAGHLSIDARTESDLGPVRAFVRMGHGRP
ncbi:porin [Methylobacterium sp. J-068]|uniref:porin n=1 Tax=Methylobacterium sp. J-068 TaxID=2836649 RepID=UPI001FB8F1A7|nr:porin [Methylobacterium sp. J-068]MCJ2034321.1 porin [Methylobacterium sp. J-068]